MARNGDGLYRRKGNRVWKFKYKDPATSEWKEHSTHTPTLSGARKIRHEWLERARQGQLPTEFADCTLEEALNSHLLYVEATLAATTLPPYRTSAGHLRRHLGERRVLHALTPEDLRGYQVARRREGAGPKTINNEILVLRAVLTRAKLWSTVGSDYKPLKVPKKGPGVAVTPDQARTLFSLANSKPGWFVSLRAGLLAYTTGCRTNEVRSLQLGDLDLDATPARIRVRRTTTKSDAGAREVVLNPIGIWAASELVMRAQLLGAAEPAHYLLPANCSKHTKPTDPLYAKRGFDVTRSQLSGVNYFSRSYCLTRECYRKLDVAVV